MLNFSTRNYGWGRGNSQYEVPRSVAGSVKYVYDYIDKGGRKLRPSPGLGWSYLENWARMKARNGRKLTDAMGIPFSVPNARKPKGGLWQYHFPFNHPWSVRLAEIYAEEWERVQTKEMLEAFENIPLTY